MDMLRLTLFTVLVLVSISSHGVSSQGSLTDASTTDGEQIKVGGAAREGDGIALPIVERTVFVKAYHAKYSRFLGLLLPCTNEKLLKIISNLRLQLPYVRVSCGVDSKDQLCFRMCVRVSAMFCALHTLCGLCIYYLNASTHVHTHSIAYDCFAYDVSQMHMHMTSLHVVSV